MYVVVYGAATCQWIERIVRYPSENDSRARENEAVKYEGKEVYLNEKTYLFGAEDADPVVVQAGANRYEFTCQLPSHLPASFESPYGSINYAIQTMLVVPWDSDIKSEIKFTVIREVDLNLQPDLKIPCESEETKQFCCLFCNSEPLVMTVTILSSGYVPGQIINVIINYNNKSTVEISTTKISFTRFIRYTR